MQFPEPEASGAVHRAVPPALKATVPVGVPVPEVGATVAAYVTVSPWITEVGMTEMFVVEADVTETGVLALDGALLASPE